MKFNSESFQSAYPDMEPLLIQHYHEIAHYKDIPLEPWLERYDQLDRAGNLKVFTVREDDNTLIGYSVFFVSYNMHYLSSLQAVQDIVFIDKKKRGFGKSFLAWCDNELKAMGVQIVYHHVKRAHNWGAVLERMGYNLVDLVYAKRLDEVQPEKTRGPEPAI